MSSRSYLFFLALCFCLKASQSYGQNEAVSRIFVVRHAEKVTDDPKDADPLLTKAGLKRAKLLSKKLKKHKLSAVFSSDFKRTKLTATPSADRNKVDLEVYNHKKLDTLVTKIKTHFKGKNVLIVGHSNSTLETVKLLGGSPKLTAIADHQYHFLFEVIIEANGNVSVIESNYGKVYDK
jgi:phosphohistidine phosphatase SixA